MLKYPFYGLFSHSHEFLSSHQTVGRKHQTESSFEDLLSAVTVHCGKISVRFLYKKKRKRFTVQLGCVALCLKPGITSTRLSLLAPCLSPAFWYLCGWLAVLGWGLEGEGVRGLAGDELTGYYWLCGGLVHKSLLSPMARTARTPANKIK